MPDVRSTLNRAEGLNEECENQFCKMVNCICNTNQIHPKSTIHNNHYMKPVISKTVLK
jgi:hypothetical protein